MTSRLPALLLLLSTLSVPAAASTGENPHGGKKACAQCHDETKKGTSPDDMVWTTGHPDDACRQCHGEDPHQVGLEPRGSVQPEPQMLLYKGLNACFSCHDEPACDGQEVNEEDPYFYRGGPYASQGELCARCHMVSGRERFNPHEAMAEGGRDEVCEHCHLVSPDPEDATADLKIVGPNICLGCHRESAHVGSKAHLVQLDRRMRASAEKAKLPLGESGNVVCVTCHDPHPSSVKSRDRDRARFTGLSVLADGWESEVLEPAVEDREKRLGAEIKPVTVESDYLRLPLEGGELCMSCHDMAGIEAMRRSER